MRRPSVRWHCSRSSGTWSPPPVTPSTSRPTHPTGPANLRTVSPRALTGRVSWKQSTHTHTHPQSIYFKPSHLLTVRCCYYHVVVSRWLTLVCVVLQCPRLLLSTPRWWTAVLYKQLGNLPPRWVNIKASDCITEEPTHHCSLVPSPSLATPPSTTSLSWVRHVVS